MYVRPNVTSKAALKRAVDGPTPVEVFSPGPYPCKQNGRVDVEGPHEPQPHTWYAMVEVVNGIVTRVL